MKKFNGPSPKLSAFRNCFEASMTYEEALGCSGLTDCEVLRNFWNYLNRKFWEG